MGITYDPSSWYWIVNDDETQAYSSAAVGFVPASNKEFKAWKSAGGLPTRIKSMDELRDVLLAQHPAGWKLEGNDLIKSQITTLEASITNRRTREAILGADNGWLANVNQQIADLRAQLT